MLGNFFQTTVRNILSHKLFSAINIFGLAIGMAAATLILLFVQDELSYDQNWSNKDSIYRLEQAFYNPGREPMIFINSAGPNKHALLEYFPEDIEASARINNKGGTIRVGETFYNERISITDPEFLKIFDFVTLKGDLEKTMSNTTSVAIDQDVAKKYFGEEDPIGKTIQLSLFNHKKDYQIGAVFQKLPENTHLRTSFLLPLNEPDFKENTWLFESWQSVNNNTYFKLKPGANIETIKNRTADYIDNYNEPWQGTKASEGIKLTITKVTDIHLKAKGLGEMKPRGNIMIVYALMAIAVMILTIAIINFMNLSTARASQRAREVSLRKVLGAKRRQLIRHFIGETFFMAFISLVISIAIVALTLPLYGQVLDREMSLDIMDPTLITAMISMLIFIGVGGGLYPSYVISAFRPAEVLKANKSTDTGGTGLVRNILVVFQFAVSIGLMVATGVVYAQLNYFQSVERGFNPENMLVINGLYKPEAEPNNLTLHEQVKKLPGVINASLIFESPGSSNENNTRVRVINDDDSVVQGFNPDGNLMGQVEVDYDFVDTYGLEMAAGRYYSKDYSLDQFPATEGLKKGELVPGNMVVNEMAVRKLGFKSNEDALGKKLRKYIHYTVDEETGEETVYYGIFTIVGVIKDAHFHTLKQIVRPELYPLRENYGYLVVRHTGSPKVIADSIKPIWTDLNPEVPFTYEVTEEALAEEMDREVRQMNIFAIFSGLAILIGCLGLYGLASFTAERRTKEIGLRKVMGARIPAIVRLMLWQFSKPILAANLIAWPTVAWIMIDWLEKFPYRINNWELVPLLFVAGLIALVVAWGTISSHAFKVARRNPIMALRYE